MTDFRHSDHIETNNRPTGHTDTTTGTFVSLYLIVLAFFAVLNSISNQEENRVTAATESVTRAFKNEFEPEADFIDVTASPDALTPNDEFYAQIQGVFASLVGFDEKFPSQGGNIITVKFKANDIFEVGSNIIRPDQQAFLNQLVNFLKGSKAQVRREISFTVFTGASLPKGPKYWEDVNVLRSGAVVNALKDRGVSPDLLSIGLQAGEEDLVQLTFYNREANASVQNLFEHGQKEQDQKEQQTIENNQQEGSL